MPCFNFFLRHTLDLQGGGFSWLFPFQNGAPPIGWHDAICYLILPAALVASQFITQKILSPSTPNDPQAQQTNAILKFLPLMIGEVPSSCLHRRQVPCRSAFLHQVPGAAAACTAHRCHPKSPASYHR